MIFIICIYKRVFFRSDSFTFLVRMPKHFQSEQRANPYNGLSTGIYQETNCCKYQYEPDTRISQLVGQPSTNMIAMQTTPIDKRICDILCNESQKHRSPDGEQRTADEPFPNTEPTNAHQPESDGSCK